MKDSMSLSDLLGLEDIRPELAMIGKRLLVSTYEDFIDVLYQDLDRCLSLIEENPGVRQTDGEDRLSAEIINMLISMTYEASHDEMIGGHADIVVKHVKGWMWIGEAKIHSDYAYLEKGFNQLTTRYLPGTPFRDQGALIVYVRGANSVGVVSRWRERLRALSLPDFTDQDCINRLDMAFFSTHRHEGSGRPVRVRHLAVKQFFDPKDRT